MPTGLDQLADGDRSYLRAYARVDLIRFQILQAALTGGECDCCRLGDTIVKRCRWCWAREGVRRIDLKHIAKCKAYIERTTGEPCKLGRIADAERQREWIAAEWARRKRVIDGWSEPLERISADLHSGQPDGSRLAEQGIRDACRERGLPEPDGPMNVQAEIGRLRARDGRRARKLSSQPVIVPDEHRWLESGELVHPREG